MTEAEIEFEKSLLRDSSTPDHGAANRHAFLDQERTELRSLRITPRAVTALTDDWAREFGEFEHDRYEMIVIAGENRSWLLFNPDTRLFSLANGELDGRLFLVGFASDDALAEWRG